HAQLGAHPGPEHRVVVDQEDSEASALGIGHRADSFAAVMLSRVVGSMRRTSVPSPGVLRISARPPWRFIRPMIDPRTPWRDSSTPLMSNPAPRSRTNT